MKYLLIPLFALACISCGDPVEKAEIGGEVSRAHFVDAVTGRCIKLETTAMADKSWASMTLETPDACRPAPPESR